MGSNHALMPYFVLLNLESETPKFLSDREMMQVGKAIPVKQNAMVGSVQKMTTHSIHQL